MIRWTGLAPWEFEFPLITPDHHSAAAGVLLFRITGRDFVGKGI